MRRVISVLLLCASMALVAPSAATGQTESWSAPADSVVVLTTEQADSLLLMIDDMVLKLDLLEADLLECQGVAPSWLGKVAGNPYLWFTTGVLVGTVIATW